MSKLSITIEELGAPRRTATSPGEMLREEFLNPLHMSANALALAVRVPANRITAILSNERSITADTAMRLGRYFGNSPRFWLNIQQNYQLSKARAQLGDKIELEVLPRNEANIA